MSRTILLYLPAPYISSYAITASYHPTISPYPPSRSHIAYPATSLTPCSYLPKLPPYIIIPYLPTSSLASPSTRG
eukprot:586252-Rhodomonas_salina.1